jgi:hypothetical protein
MHNCTIEDGDQTHMSLHHDDSCLVWVLFGDHQDPDASAWFASEADARDYDMHCTAAGNDVVQVCRHSVPGIPDGLLAAPATRVTLRDRYYSHHGRSRDDLDVLAIPDTPATAACLDCATAK